MKKKRLGACWSDRGSLVWSGISLVWPVLRILIHGLMHNKQHLVSRSDVNGCICPGREIFPAPLPLEIASLFSIKGFMYSSWKTKVVITFFFGICVLINREGWVYLRNIYGVWARIWVVILPLPQCLQILTVIRYGVDTPLIFVHLWISIYWAWTMWQIWSGLWKYIDEWDKVPALMKLIF